jgi:hypothetical protein
MEGSGCGLIVRHYPSIFLEGMRKTKKSLSQDSQCPSQDLNPGPPTLDFLNTKQEC